VHRNGKDDGRDKEVKTDLNMQWPGDRAWGRPFEVAAAFNRLRTLRVKSGREKREKTEQRL
jgi:hypothetical protein